jgi:hypothetical protein
MKVKGIHPAFPYCYWWKDTSILLVMEKDTMHIHTADV